MRSAVVAVGAMLLVGAGPAPAIQPGLWELTMRMTSVAGPGVPPEMAQAMAGRAHTMRNCVRPSDIEKAPERVFQSSDGQCSYTRFSMRNGIVDAVMQCTGAQGRIDGRMTGRYTATSYVATNTMTMPGGMVMKSNVSGRRIGHCT